MTAVATVVAVAEEIVVEAVAFAKAHPELVKAMSDFVHGQKIDGNELLRLAMVTASDLEMQRELGV